MPPVPLPGPGSVSTEPVPRVEGGSRWLQAGPPVYCGPDARPGHQGRAPGNLGAHGAALRAHDPEGSGGHGGRLLPQHEAAHHRQAHHVRGAVAGGAGGLPGRLPRHVGPGIRSTAEVPFRPPASPERSRGPLRSPVPARHTVWHGYTRPRGVPGRSRPREHPSRRRGDRARAAGPEPAHACAREVAWRAAPGPRHSRCDAHCVRGSAGAPRPPRAADLVSS